MATHCCFGTVYPHGYMVVSYIHWDGYPDVVGRTLKEYYRTENRVRSLLDLGELSTLGVFLKGDLKNWDMPNTKGLLKYTIAYKRDLGYPLVKARSFKGIEDTDNTLKDYLFNKGADYLYLFDVEKQEWVFYKLHRYDYSKFFERIKN